MSARLIRRITEVIGLVDPKFEDDCNDAVHEIVSELENLPSEKGKATLTITFEFDFEKGLFNIVPGLKTKLPEGKRYGRTPFWSHDGALSTQHPKQIDMFGPREVDSEEAVNGG